MFMHCLLKNSVIGIMVFFRVCVVINIRCRPSLCAGLKVSWLQSAYILQSSQVVSSINPVEFVSITLCTRSCWCEVRSPRWMEGLPHIYWVRWLQDMQSDLRHHPFFIFLFPAPSWECRKVGQEERKDSKLLGRDNTEHCYAYRREEGTSR